MAKYLFRVTVQSLLLSLAFVLAQSGSLLETQVAQQSSFADLAPIAELGSDGPVETASFQPAPSAPGMGMPLAEASPSIAHGSSVALVPAAVVPVIAVPAAAAAVNQRRNEFAPHRFWDRENRILFATTGALAAADFCATRANLASGGRELNPVTGLLSGSTPGLAANFALEAGSVMAVSYLFHRTGHHKLERLTTIVNIGASAAASGYSFSHR